MQPSLIPRDWFARQHQLVFDKLILGLRLAIPKAGVIVFDIVLGKHENDQFEWPIVAPAHKSEQFLVGAITSVSEIKNFVPRKPYFSAD